MCYLPEGLFQLPAGITGKEVLEAVGTDRLFASRAIMFDGRKVLHTKLCGLEVRIPYEECAQGLREGNVREVAVVSRVGRPICYVLTGRREENGRTVLCASRTAAQEMCRANYLDLLQPGDIIPCVVTHIEPFGAFCDVGCGISALLPIDSLSVSRIHSPEDRVQVGQQIFCAIKSRDQDGRFLLTLRELLGTWEENAAFFTPGTSVMGVVRTVEEYGVFVELAPNLAGLAELAPELVPGELVSVYIKSILPEKMKVKLAILQQLGEQAKPGPLRYFLKEGHLDRWLYSPPGAKKQVETLFLPPEQERGGPQPG